MSLIVGDNFNYQGRKPLDNRLVVSSFPDLLSLAEGTLYNGIIVYVLSEKKYYTYDENNDAATGSGKWIEFQRSGATPSVDKTIDEYAQSIIYKENMLLFYGNLIYRTLKDFTSNNTDGYTVEQSLEQDLLDGNLIILNREAQPGIMRYTQNTYYEHDKLVYADKRIGRVLNDYISDNTGTTIEESINIDIAAGNLLEIGENYKFKLYRTTQDMNKEIDAINELPISTIQFENNETIDNMQLNEGVYGPLGTLSIITEIDKNNGIIKTKSISTREMEFMPPAPAEYKIVIDLPGNDYAVNDIVDSSLDLFSIKITEVDENGGIIAAELINKTTALNTNGYGAIIDAKPKLYLGHKKTWYEYTEETGQGESTKQPLLQEYQPGTAYLKNALIVYDNILYKAMVNFSSASTEVEIIDNLNNDIQAGNLVKLTPDTPEVPECLGSFMSDEAAYLPTNAVKGNWGLVLDCVETAPGQPGIALYTDTGWTITPIPKGKMEFPEPAADGKPYFRTVDDGATDGKWAAFESADGSDITITFNLENDGTYVPKLGEPVWYDNKMLIGDGTTDLMSLEPFYVSNMSQSDLFTLIGYTPEDKNNKGQANGYAPLDADSLVPKAYLPLEVTDTYSKTDIDQKDTDILNDATTAINAEASRATAKETTIETKIDNHIADTSLHVTQTEKDDWNAKVDASDLVDYDNHLTDTAIHVTQADKDKWDGMNKAYFVTSVSNLPSVDNQIGNIGYVQTSAAGVIPIVCEEYLWTGTEWKKLDTTGVSISFNWDNLIGKPASTPLTIDNTVTIAHSHNNKAVLEKIGQSPSGEFTWNGEPIGIQAIFLENENALPDIGEENTLYIVYEDSRVRNFPSISVYKNNAFQILGRGTQDAPPTVGEMSILQVEYFGVKENSTFNITISPQTSFCFMPVEILKEQLGKQNVQTTVFDCGEIDKISYNENLFKLDATSKLTFDIKSIPTTIDTVGDVYFSHAIVDLSDYYDVQSIS